MPSIHVVTGAFGFSGQYIARRLLERGHLVRSLSNSPNTTSPLAARVDVRPLQFDDREGLVESLRGAEVLYNTYWVRFNHRRFNHADAVDNTRRLFDAARTAGVGRVVHVSITNPDEQSPLEYFRGKGQLERALVESGVSHAILRPAVLFGLEDVLINNIAWMLRHLPVFGVFGDGRYRLQPIHVDDLARLAVEQGELRSNVVVNAIGPETFEYGNLVRQIGHIIGCRRPILSVPPWFGLLTGRLLGFALRDVVITKEEITGLMAERLYVDARPTGATPLTDWLHQHANRVGRRYASELARRR